MLICLVCVILWLSQKSHSTFKVILGKSEEILEAVQFYSEIWFYFNIMTMKAYARGEDTLAHSGLQCSTHLFNMKKAKAWCEFALINVQVSFSPIFYGNLHIFLLACLTVLWHCLCNRLKISIIFKYVHVIDKYINKHHIIHHFVFYSYFHIHMLYTIQHYSYKPIEFIILYVFHP